MVQSINLTVWLFDGLTDYIVHQNIHGFWLRLNLMIYNRNENEKMITVAYSSLYKIVYDPI